MAKIYLKKVNGHCCRYKNIDCYFLNEDNKCNVMKLKTDEILKYNCYGKVFVQVFPENKDNIKKAV